MENPTIDELKSSRVGKVLNKLCKSGYRHGLISLKTATVDLAKETMDKWKNFFKTQDAQ